LAPSVKRDLSFIKPGFPLKYESESDILCVIIAENARLIGPATQGLTVGNMIYAEKYRLFRYLGKMKYRFPSTTPTKKLGVDRLVYL
jgi:hypothetical protein